MKLKHDSPYCQDDEAIDLVEQALRRGLDPQVVEVIRRDGGSCGHDYFILRINTGQGTRLLRCTAEDTGCSSLDELEDRDV